MALSPAAHLLIATVFTLQACSCGGGRGADAGVLNERQAIAPSRDAQAAGHTVGTRFAPPMNCVRESYPTGSFSQWLREMPLKPPGSEVRYFDGTIKPNTGSHAAVIDFDAGDRDLQQCADAVMRLRAEYLFSQGRHKELHFNFLSDGRPRYYSDFAGTDTSYARFRKWLDYIYSYANTASLKHEMVQVQDLESVVAGDVFIESGHPYGHAVIIVDMARDTLDGRRWFMAAQSFMPAQDIHVLVNPYSSSLSPWFVLEEGEIMFPDWLFETTDIRRFR